MSEFKCNECERDFSSQEALDQHNADKHGLGGTQPKHELKQLKKQEREKQQELEKKKASRSKLLKRGVYVVILVLLITAVFVFVSSQPSVITNENSVVSSSEIPNGPIHWHPTLTIKLNGQQQIIPANLGLTGTVHQPIHTHDSTGVLHYENNNPTLENMQLRYFFDKVWRKQFNSTCILNYCNDGSKTVKMFVNGKENSEFENYIPKDKDEIIIEFN